MVLILIALGWGIRKVLGPDATKIIWLKVKWLLGYLYLILIKQRLKPAFSFDEKSEHLDKSGLTSLPEARRKENPRTLLENKQAVDSINIWGADESGNALMVRVARRHGRIAELWIYLRLATGEEYQAPVQPDLRTYNTDGKSFSVKGLHFEVLEPLRRWRIGFNGTLRKGVKSHWDTEDDEHSVSAKFNFIWHPMYSCSSYPSDFNTKLTAKTLAKFHWGKEFFFNRKLTSSKWHEQWGQMHGSVVVDKKNLTLLLTGTKTREFGVLDWKTVNKKLVIRGIDSIGTAIDLYAEADANGQLNVYHGEVAPPSNKGLYSVSMCDIGNADVAYFGGNEKEVKIDLIADGRKFHLKLGTGGSQFQFFAGENWDCQGYCKLIELEINGKHGFGLIEAYEKYGQGSPLISLQSVFHLVEPDFITNDFTLTFKDKACMNSKLVGGKGASLAMMTLLSKQDDRFAVPPGFCLTKACFEHHLKDNISLELAIYRLEDVAWKRKGGDLALECSRLTDLIVNSSLSEALKDKLADTLRKTFGEGLENIQFAVRSSAIGEDGEEMSAAGQNETYLGVIGLGKIYEAVLKCWASQFSFRSVEYKRQHGQLLNGGMAVVIQEMISAEVAGVLFSRDPLTGNPMKMVISANYGLGESVVSATADPDTIILDRNWSDELSIAEVAVGKKETKHVLRDEGGTLETKVEALDASRCTVSDVIALKLGRMAIGIEKHFGSSRDIEWALQAGKIYLLQARPITSGLAMTDCEVWHEFDIAMRTPREQFTTANVAEVMPGALSPLFITSGYRAIMLRFERIMARKSKKFSSDPIVLSAMPLYTNHSLMDEIWAQEAYVSSSEKSTMAKVSELSMYGRVMDNSKALQLAKERYANPSGSDILPAALLSLQGLLNSKKIVTSMEDKYQNFPTPAAGIPTPREAYQEIGKHFADLMKVFKDHMAVTIGSIIWNGFTLILLSNGAGDFNLDVYSDFASLIGGNNGFESGEVPARLQEIVASIIEEDVSMKFVSLPPQDALDWMNTKLNRASAQFQEFLQRHGHRGIKELDVKSITWSMEPTKVVKMLQAMLQMPPNSETNKRSPTIDEAIKTLKISLTPLKRKLLKWLVSRTINGIRHRERAKSVSVKVTHGLRMAYHHLAALMVRDGFIPEEELLFFMTFEEIGELMETRSARIIKRARQRYLQFPYMDSIEYPEMIKGLPIPIHESDEDDRFVRSSEVKGIPVCHGRIKGIARVIVKLDQVDSLKRNDILVTHATDIGWTPYFPMLGGVVTELGGLISHGAVVAREYGLPCIIDAANATKIFKSGDEVLLDATKGIITKLTRDEK